MRKIFSILFALVLALGVSLVAVPVGANGDPPNTVASSTMVFKGELTAAGGGVYTGTISMADETTTPGFGDGIAGFDVYAKNGANAYVQGLDPNTWTIANHDAYAAPGPWGAWWDPDCADWNQYSLQLTANHWYLRYTPTGESPMSGVMYWYGDGTGYAAETDPGTLDGTDPTQYGAGSAQEWGWDCGWGAERVPLELPGFAVVVTSGGSYTVTLTPGAGRVLNVNTGATYGTIQSAVDDAGVGHTIEASAGMYDEQVVINKSLTLEGAGDTAIVKPSSAAKLTQVFTGLFWYGGTKQIAGIIVANVAGGSVTIKNLKVDESLVTTKPTGADYLAGIFYRETGGLVDTVSIVGTGPWCTTDRAYGMYLSAGTNTVTVEVKNSGISNYDKNGIEVMGNMLTVNIHHNTITGRGSISDEAQNGVSVGRDAVATANYNTISDLAYYLPTSAVATGILIYHYVTPTGKSATANGNTITNCQVGIMFKNANGSAQDNIVSGGTVGLDGIFAQPNYAGAYIVSFVHNTVSGMTKNAAIDAETYATLTPGTGATLTVTISNNTLTGGYTTADGIYIGGGAGGVTATISDNTISGCPEHGINLGDACVAGATITGNTIINNAMSGLYIGAAVNAANVNAHFNNIVGNVNYGVNNGGTGTLDARYNWWGASSGPGPVGPGTGDNVSANVVYDSWTGKIATSTGTGTASFTPDAGNITPPAAVPVPASPPVALPHGLFSFNVTGLTPGQTVTLTVTLPGSVPVGTKWWKYQGGAWYWLPIGDDDGDNIITITLTDGVSPGDADNTANGQITDPGGPGYFALAPAYGLVISSTEGGSVTTPGEGTFPYLPGEVVSLVASPDAGYKFVNWSGDVATIADVHDASTTITMENWYSITANFESEEIPQPQPQPTVPTVTTKAATSITTNSTTLNMNYTVGNYTSVDVRFAYKKSVDSAWSYTAWVSKSGSGTYATPLTPLDSSTKYDFKAQLKYNDTVIEGTTLQFTTATPSTPSPSEGGCFIATAAYGTPTAKQIDVLREFRDVVLLESTAGSQFVALYYQLSPPIADFIAGNSFLRTLVRELLVDPIVWVVEATGDIWLN